MESQSHGPSGFLQFLSSDKQHDVKLLNFHCIFQCVLFRGIQSLFGLSILGNYKNMLTPQKRICSLCKYKNSFWHI